MKLKPCPFCEGETEILEDWDKADIQYTKLYYIACQKCFCCTSQWKSLLEAIKAWNTRIEKKPSVDEIKKMFVESMQKEAIRNGNNPHDHGFSKFCSCGICHTASMLAKVIHDRLNKGEG